MRLSYQVTGQKRKALVAAISEELNSPTRYMGAPTFAYEVGGYTIDKNGTLTGVDNPELECALLRVGFISIDSEHFTQETPELGLGRSHLEDFQGENGMQASDVPDTIVIELPIINVAPGMLAALIGSKASLIKAALGEDSALPCDAGVSPLTNLPIFVDEREGTATFEWLRFGVDSDVVQAWSAFFAAAVRFAKSAKRVTAKNTVVDNQKFAFRVFLIRLGLIGAEHKTTRRILLRNLTGCSAWKHGAPVRDEKGAAA